MLNSEKKYHGDIFFSCYVNEMLLSSSYDIWKKNTGKLLQNNILDQATLNDDPSSKLHASEIDPEYSCVWYETVKLESLYVVSKL